jgi:hypothetical protein
MTITRANAEAMIVKQVGPLLSAAGMAVTVVGSNASLNYPIGYALIDLDYTVSDITSVVDADVAQVTNAKLVEFVDMAVLHTLEDILGNLDDVDITVGPRTEKFSQLAAQVERKLALQQEKVEKLYGYGGFTLEGGYITKRVTDD